MKNFNYKIRKFCYAKIDKPDNVSFHEIPNANNNTADINLII